MGEQGTYTSKPFRYWRVKSVKIKFLAHPNISKF